jgi:hypothetical protein
MLGAEGGPLFPFVRKEFSFTSGLTSTQAYDTTAVGAAAKLGAAVVFP